MACARLPRLDIWTAQYGSAVLVDSVPKLLFAFSEVTRSESMVHRVLMILDNSKHLKTANSFGKMDEILSKLLVFHSFHEREGCESEVDNAG